MRTIESTAGSVRHTNTEYDALSGYYAGCYSYEWEDRHGNTWRTTCEVVNLGRADRSNASKPQDDETIERTGRGMSRERQELMTRITELLRERPMTAREISIATGETLDRIKSFFRDYGSTAFVVTKQGPKSSVGKRGNVYALQSNQ